MPPQQPQGLNMMPSNKGNGALIGSVIVIIILIGIAAYLMSSKKTAPSPANTSPNTEQATQNPTGDESGSIAASSSATVTDADLESIEKALGASNADLSTDFKAFDSAQ